MATNIMGLVDYVQNKGDIGEKQGQQSRLASLASQAYTTPAGQQNALLGQMAQVSPEFAQGQQKQFQQQGDDRARKAAGAAKYVLSAVERGDPAAIQGAYRTVYPYLSELVTSTGGQAPPDQWDPAMAEGMHQILAAVEGGGAGGQGVQSTYVDDQGQRIAIMRDGSTRILGGNDAGATQQTITINGPDGRPAQYTFDRRTGSYVPAGAGMGAPQAQQQQQPAYGGPQQFTGSDGAPVSIGADIPPNVAAQIREMEMGSGVPDQFNAAPVGVQQRGFTGSPFVGRAPEEQAALTTAAQERVKLGFLPETERIRTHAELEKAAGLGEIARGNEAATLDGTRSRDANKTLSLLAEAEELLPGATGSRSGAIADDVAAFVGRSTEGAQKTAALKTIAGQLTSSMPRMQGPQSDKDVQLYKEMAGDLANDSLPVATRQAALRQIRALNEKYAGQQPGQQAAVRRATNPQTGEVLELRNGQWVPAQ